MQLSTMERAAGFTIGTVRDAADKLDIRYGIYGELSPKDRYMVFLNGRTEWIEKYAYLPHDLQLPADCGFITLDHRGQGASGGARSYVDSYESFASDAARVIEATVRGKPYVILSHSMGGLIALYGYLRGYLKPQRLALSSPLFGLPNDPVPHVLAKPLAKLLALANLGTISSGAGSFTRPPFEANKLTHDADLYRRMCETPYPVPGATFGWVDATFQALNFIFQVDQIKKLSIATLIMSGTNEHVVDSKATEAWMREAEEYAPAEIQLRLIPGARHELFSETQEYYETAIRSVKDWFRPFFEANTGAA